MIFLLCLLIVVVVDPGEPWSAAIIVAGALLEVGEVVALRAWSKRLGRRYRPVAPGDELLGRRATVITACRPTGQVKLGGEIWQAVCETGAGLGETVRVQSVDGLTLRVRSGGRGRAVSS